MRTKTIVLALSAAFLLGAAAYYVWVVRLVVALSNIYPSVGGGINYFQVGLGLAESGLAAVLVAALTLWVVDSLVAGFRRQHHA